MFALYWFGISITLLHSDMPAVAILLVAPFFYMDRPIRPIIITLTVMVILITLSHLHKDHTIAHMDMWNCFGLGIAAIAIEIVQMKDKFQSIANSKRIVYLSQTDVLTGAKNRNTYEDRIQRSISRISGDTVVLYADVNGLHEMNNTKGHSAGDKMLKTVASALINRFGADNTYRIGGDEFIVLISGGALENTRQDMDAIIKMLEENGYHISVGIAFGNNSELQTVVKAAEHEMYAMKSEFYRTRGIDRRRTRGINNNQ